MFNLHIFYLILQHFILENLLLRKKGSGMEGSLETKEIYENRSNNSKTRKKGNNTSFFMTGVYFFLRMIFELCQIIFQTKSTSNQLGVYLKRFLTVHSRFILLSKNINVT